MVREGQEPGEQVLPPEQRWAKEQVAMGNQALVGFDRLDGSRGYVLAPKVGNPVNQAVERLAAVEVGPDGEDN